MTRADVLGGFVDLPQPARYLMPSSREFNIDAFGGHQRFILYGDGRVGSGQNTFEVVGGQRFAQRRSATTCSSESGPDGRSCTGRAGGDKQDVIGFRHAVLGGAVKQPDQRLDESRCTPSREHRDRTSCRRAYRFCRSRR